MKARAAHNQTTERDLMITQGLNRASQLPSSSLPYQSEKVRSGGHMGTADRRLAQHSAPTASDYRDSNGVMRRTRSYLAITSTAAVIVCGGRHWVSLHAWKCSTPLTRWFPGAATMRASTANSSEYTLSFNFGAEDSTMSLPAG